MGLKEEQDLFLFIFWGGGTADYPPPWVGCGWRGLQQKIKPWMARMYTGDNAASARLRNLHLCCLCNPRLSHI
jgi:hypothetical protein